MGVYYYFSNLTQNKDNEKNIEGACKHVAKMHYLDEDAMADILEDVIRLNEWNKTDVIQAAPDYPEYPIIIYDAGEIRIINMQNLGVNPDRMEDDMASNGDSLSESSSESSSESPSESTKEETQTDELPAIESIDLTQDVTYDVDDYDGIPRRYPIVIDDAPYSMISDNNYWDQKEEDYDY